MEYLNGCSKPFEGTRTISGPFPNLFSLVNEKNRHIAASGGTDQMLGANRADDGFGFVGRILNSVDTKRCECRGLFAESGFTTCTP